MPFELHWLRIEWLWALPLAVLLPWWCRSIVTRPKGWEQLIARHLLKALAIEQVATQQHWRWTLGVIVALLVLALAGPSWQRLPQPAFNLKRGTVLLMDMSLSMHATDVKPDRLAQARFKAIDFANLQAEGDMALVSFAGDAFVITPLTPDHNNITLMIPMLKPEIMPAQGSDLLSALKMADKLLTQAGYTRGDVVAFTDGFVSSQAIALRDYIDDYPHRLSIVAFGTAEGAPIKLEQGTLLKDNQGSIVIPRVPLQQLEQLATVTGGVFTEARYDKVDIDTIAKLSPLDQAAAKQRDERFQGEQWQDGAVWLLWLTLPLIAWWLRKTPLLMVIMLCSVSIKSPPVQAHEPAAPPTPAVKPAAASWLDSVKSYLWQTPAERAHQQYQQGEYQQAQQGFDNPTWQGNAAYRLGDYALAEQLYRQTNDATSHYNLGNALAKQQKLPEALQAYQAAKQQQPDLPGLDQNIQLIQQLLKQQQQQAQQQSGQQSSDKQQSTDQKQQQSQQQSEQNSQQSAAAQANGGPAQQSGQDQDGKGEQQQQQAQQGKPQQQEQQQMQVAEEQKDAQETKAVREAWPNATPEQTQQLDAILRKVQDDPYQLLHNKMVLEYQRRNAQAPQQGDQQEW